MNKYRAISVAVAGVLALLSMPVVALAQPIANQAEQIEPPCIVVESEPCTQSSSAAAPDGSTAPIPEAHELTPAELNYHRETTAHMNRSAAASAILPVWVLTPAELQYHRDTVEHMQGRVRSATDPSAGAASAPAYALAAQIEALSGTYPAASSAQAPDLKAKIDALSATYPAAASTSPTALVAQVEGTLSELEGDLVISGVIVGGWMEGAHLVYRGRMVDVIAGTYAGTIEFSPSAVDNTNPLDE